MNRESAVGGEFAVAAVAAEADQRCDFYVGVATLTGARPIDLAGKHDFVGKGELGIVEER